MIFFLRITYDILNDAHNINYMIQLKKIVKTTLKVDTNTSYRREML